MLRTLHIASVAILFSIGALVAADEKTEEENAAAEQFSTLKLLPKGSVLKRVNMPRFDKNLKPLSMFQAQELTVSDKEILKAKDVTLKAFEPDGGVRFQAELEVAKYDQAKALLSSASPVTLSADTMNTRSNGMYMDWQRQKGFLVGPVHTTFQFDTNKTTMRSLKQSSILATCALAMGSATEPAQCAIPAPLSAEEATQLEQLAKAPAKVFISQSEIKSMNEVMMQSSHVTKASAAFLKSIGQMQLIQNAPSADAKKPEDDSVDLSNVLDAKSDGGMFFDAKKGFFSYQKNVRITEPRFKLKCDKELQVYLVEGFGAKKPKDTPKSDPKAPKKKKGIEDIVRQMIATGNVEIEGKFEDKEKKRTLNAKADVMVYDVKSGLVTLKGGFPELRVKEGGRVIIMTAKEPNLWIKIEKDGSYRTSPGSWHQRLAGLNQ